MYDEESGSAYAPECDRVNRAHTALATLHPPDVNVAFDPDVSWLRCDVFSPLVCMQLRAFQWPNDLAQIDENPAIYEVMQLANSNTDNVWFHAMGGDLSRVRGLKGFSLWSSETPLKALPRDLLTLVVGSNANIGPTPLPVADLTRLEVLDVKIPVSFVFGDVEQCVANLKHITTLKVIRLPKTHPTQSPKPTKSPKPVSVWTCSRLAEMVAGMKGLVELVIDDASVHNLVTEGESAVRAIRSTCPRIEVMRIWMEVHFEGERSADAESEAWRVAHAFAATPPPFDRRLCDVKTARSVVVVRVNFRAPDCSWLRTVLGAWL